MLHMVGRAALALLQLRDHATRYGFVRRSVSRFMPGERIEDALRAARELSGDGITTILTHLGENLTSAAEAEDVQVTVNARLGFRTVATLHALVR